MGGLRNAVRGNSVAGPTPEHRGHPVPTGHAVPWFRTATAEDAKKSPATSCVMPTKATICQFSVSTRGQGPRSLWQASFALCCKGGALSRQTEHNRTANFAAATPVPLLQRTMCEEVLPRRSLWHTQPRIAARVFLLAADPMDRHSAKRHRRHMSYGFACVPRVVRQPNKVSNDAACERPRLRVDDRRPE